jgi:hypothetical protein
VAVLVLSLVVLTLGGLFIAGRAQAVPERVALSGRVIDLTCATKGHAMMGHWGNAEMTHTMPGTGGKRAPECARMCLRGGQPAALFDGQEVSAIFICNARTTLAEYVTEAVEVEGYWGYRPAKTFFPERIRRPGDEEWQMVGCATMH